MVSTRWSGLMKLWLQSMTIFVYLNQIILARCHFECRWLVVGLRACRSRGSEILMPINRKENQGTAQGAFPVHFEPTGTYLTYEWREGRQTVLVPPSEEEVASEASNKLVVAYSHLPAQK
jgi:hypothetical protein